MSNENKATDWKAVAHSDPGMIYLRKALASAAKQAEALTMEVWSAENKEEYFICVGQKEIARAAKWVLEIDEPVTFFFYNSYATQPVGSVVAYFQGQHSKDNYMEIVVDCSNYMTLPVS